ncbi:ABC transporter permease subunit [Altererythrobacter sp. SALINAS58]|uniref:ABC transporter permease/substrate-binding protein n=1 Tax=Alteripontixanthobacter muriae TaxID=2705546 RepID=UPI001574FDE8|nr:ABC transporter permease/substrate-binding protein [Alteripontixanthobacter muriae]NTZ43900.1 ABC transporter permease subunit [Alteripontixanthobacter muriae]
MSDIAAILVTLGPKLAQHVLLAGSALALGIIIALPLAVWASRSASVARVALTFASLVQTIPALALLALFFPLLLSLRAIFGEGLPTLGFLPALLALALYALLPILRNAVTAREHMAAGVLEAADGVGMTPAQKLRWVEAPLAAPYIMAGIRTAAVWTIGAATLSTTVGQPSLGDPIFAGLQTQNWALVLAGCIASAGLAIVADLLLGTVERGFRSRDRRHSRWMVRGGLLLLALGVAAALWSMRDRSDEGAAVIGAKNFSEQYILARLIGQRLEEAGYAVRYREGLGSAVIHRALASGNVDLAVDYTGTLWTNELQREDMAGRDAMFETIREWEERETGIHVLGRLGFENAYAFAMRRDVADRLGIETLDDLAREAPRLTIGGDIEFFERPEWRAVRQAYGLGFAEQRSFQATFMYDALAAGEADVISAYTSDGRIAADDLVVLEDPRGALPTYDAILMLAPGISEDEDLLRVLRPLLGQIDVAAMRRANHAVDRAENKRSPAEAARMLAREITR